MSTSKLQRYVSDMLSVHFGGLTIRENIRPDWLITHNGNRLELDFYIEELEAAIEVQGEQHYRYVPFFHGTNDGFRRRLEWDDFKRETCYKAGVKLYEVSDLIDALDTLEALLSTLVVSEHFVPTMLAKQAVEEKIEKTKRKKKIKAGKVLYRHFRRHYTSYVRLSAHELDRQLESLSDGYPTVTLKNIKNILEKAIAEGAMARYRQNVRRREAAKRRRARNKVGFVFIMESTSGHYRIGCSTKPEKRAETMRFMVPGHECELRHVIPSDDFRNGCAQMQSWFVQYIGNWFSLSHDEFQFIRNIVEHKDGGWIAKSQGDRNGKS